MRHRVILRHTGSALERDGARERKRRRQGSRERWRKTGIKGKTQTIEVERAQSQNPATNSKLSRNKKLKKHRSQKQ